LQHSINDFDSSALEGKVIFSEVTILSDSTVRTGKGDDNLNSGISAKNLTLDGGAGNVIITGGAGNDQLTGGTRNDTFAFRGSAIGHDAITDFDKAVDTIDLKGYSKASVHVAHTADASIITSSEFTGSITVGVTGLTVNDFLF